ncbi:MAG TPA: hypothetical protein VJY62_07895, partial [Bacteroidia bacterium]|nr:hypothetical protein [Bacteroidia bacterium]
MLPLKHKAVNWIDGMKISKDHFIQQEFFYTDQIRDAAAGQLSRINYGLLSPVDESGKTLNVKINVDPAKVIRVDLLECHAITSNGERIEIATNNAIKLNNDQDKLVADFDYTESREKTFYVVVSVNLFSRNPVGQMDPDEIPARYPFVTPQYTVEILPESQISSSENSILLIGKLQLIAGRMQVDNKFIPACIAVKNHPLLHEAYYNLGNQLGETANLNLSIVQNVHAKSQLTSMVKSFLALSEKVSDFFASELGRFRWIIADLPPVFFVEYFIRFAYIIKFSLERLPAKDKEELMSYFSEWTEVSVSDMNDKITKMIRTEYNHDDIAQSLNVAEEF